MFGHLQVYSAFSFQESTISISQLVAQAKRQNISCLALTDHHQMFGMMAFKHACEKNQIKPIYGLELTINYQGSIAPFILLAKDTPGYFALAKLASQIQLEEKEALDFSLLLPYKDHLFFLLSGEDSIIYRLLLKEMTTQALDYLKAFKKELESHLFICLVDHGLALQKNINKQLIGLAHMCRVPLVCSNAVRYLKKEEATTLEYLHACQKQMVLSGIVHPMTNQAYLKNEAEMHELFDDEIISNTTKLLLACNATIPTDQKHLPVFQCPKNARSDEYLRALCRVGLKKRFKDQTIRPEYIQRLNYELDVIIQMKFADYFLIVYDYVRYAKTNGILVGPGRGSAAGSLVAYVLGITNVDPIRYQLLFERFLNPERVSMPDIDVDFQDDRREEVVNYVIERYGKNHVCQIVSFNTYGPKVAIKDLGKAAGVAPVKLEQVSKMVPTTPKLKKSAYEMYQTSNAFQSAIRKEATLNYVMPSVFIVENLPRNISTHAAGVILSNDKLQDVVPLALGPSKTVVSQYSKDYIEEVGLLKMDFLGLRNLTILAYILKGIETDLKIHIDLNTIPLNDKKTYELIAAGDTFGVFQLESDGMISLLRKMRVSSFEDVVAAIALFRPGPMKNIPTYLARKLKQEPITYVHDDLKDILEPTYGIMIYQEQIMQITTRMAGFTLGKADILRKAISKKENRLMQEMRQEFMAGTMKKGYSQEVAQKVYNDIERFADYGFNRSHSVAYGLLAYQMAYLKVHYPLHFFAALLSHNQSSDHSKLICVQEAKKYGVMILPPSINLSSDRFVVENHNIRYSLLAIKDVGIASYQSIAKEREKHGHFKSYKEFLERMANYHLSTKTYEALIDAGALDEFNAYQPYRKMMKKNLNMVLDAYNQAQITGLSFDMILETVKDDLDENLENEKRALGIYLSSHPVARKRESINRDCMTINKLDKALGKTVGVVLRIERIKTIRDKRGQNMCFLSCFDETGNVDCTLFSDQYERYQRYLKKGNIIYVKAKVNYRDAISLVVNELEAL